MLRTQKRLAVALGSRIRVAMFIAGAVVGGSLIVALPMSQSGISRATSAVLAYWTTMLTAAPTATASVATTFDVHAALQAAPKDAPVQASSVIACTYVLTEGHRCD